MSGIRATFTPRPGAIIEEETLASALKKRRLGLKSLTKETRPRPAHAYRIEATGLG